MIGEYAFSGCSGLTSITFPNSDTSIGDDAFIGTAWYNSQPDGMVYINNIAYKYKGIMPANTAITLKAGTIGIAGFTFSDCSGLTAITIPNSVVSIGNSAFYSCNSLTIINVDVANTNYSSIDGILFNKDKTTIVCYPAGKQTGYTIPNSITSIGDYAFCGCSKLTSITIPSSVTSIGSSAFDGCTSLTSITIPNSVTLIENEAFPRCTGLTAITIPSSVTSIGDYAFNYCTDLTIINVDVANTNYSSADGVLFNKDKTTIVCYPAGKKQATYTIPSSVTSIGSGAFSWCTNLSSITIPNSVTSIENEAFSDCTDLTAITIPNSVTLIGDYAFNYCIGFTNITIPNSVISIGSWAFQSCRGLTSITIPSSVTSIEGAAFALCSGLTSVVLPSSVTSIGSSAFSGCSGLTTITIPSSVTSIGNDAFSDCSGLTSIYANAITPINLSSSSNVFRSVNKTTGTLYVPNGSKEAYQAAIQWKDFTNIIEVTTAIPQVNKLNLSISPNPANGLIEIKGLESSANLRVYNLKGQELLTRTINPNETISINTLAQGLYIVKVNSREGAFETKVIKE